ncbi:hypothetical protein [Terasakiella sp. SH-1]|uniref:hypothetical protein n=1 Tax=Terasakiella sp. SH-1 TaxID=2560057 RepID=UPI001073A158|nr:hypothetical protein [Terasakiella sp. SH-1]
MGGYDVHVPSEVREKIRGYGPEDVEMSFDVLIKRLERDASQGRESKKLYNHYGTGAVLAMSFPEEKPRSGRIPALPRVTAIYSFLAAQPKQRQAVVVHDAWFNCAS